MTCGAADAWVWRLFPTTGQQRDVGALVYQRFVYACVRPLLGLAPILVVTFSYLPQKREFLVVGTVRQLVTLSHRGPKPHDPAGPAPPPLVYAQKPTGREVFPVRVEVRLCSAPIEVAVDASGTWDRRGAQVVFPLVPDAKVRHI